METEGSEPPPAYPVRQQQPFPQQQYGQAQPDAQYHQGQQYPGQQYPGQQYPGQQPYGQQQYAPQPAPTTVIVVNQPPPVPHDYSFPGKCSSIDLIIGAIANLLCWIIFGAIHHIWDGTEWFAAFIFYMIAGVLGAVGSFRKQSHPGIAIGTIVMSVFSLVVAFVQLIREFVVVATKDIGISWPFIIMGVVGLVAFMASIILIVVASQAVCACCKQRQQ
ncbi:uncharacterized protein LOC135498875 isoform X2 [Lineus longissimus]|uniref:uncharacterized protein LOC135498875 isoform X2 n=1 Tax=Lineus longissimus TaxID=88925 RepID=UPI00315D92F8